MHALVTKLAEIYASQIKFLYACAAIGVLLGCIAIHGNYDLAATDKVFHQSYAVNLLLLFYCVILAEALLRPLLVKLTAIRED